jgi:hypothetical protein
MTAAEFESLYESEPELEAAYPEYGWESGLYSRFREGELAPRRTKVAISPQIRRQIEKHKLAHDRLMGGVAAVRKHVSLRNGRLYFTLPARSTRDAATKLGISHGLFMQIYNSMKRSGVQNISRPILSAEAEFESRQGCAGETSLNWRWFGATELRLNECDTRTLTDLMKGGGAAVGGACKFLGPEGVLLCGVIAGLGIGFAYLIDAVDHHGGSQGVKFTFLPGVPLPMVTAQEHMVPLSDVLDQAMAKMRQATARP